MALLNLTQIKGGKELQSDVAALKQSYQAAKVITTIEKTAASGDNPAVYYNADELLAALKTGLDSVNGVGEGSLSALQTAISSLSSKQIKDTVRIGLTATYDDPDFTITTDAVIATAAPGFATSTALPVYTLDNKVVYDTTGEQLTYTFSTNTFSGTPAELDVDASKADTNDALHYKAIEETFNFKVFPVGTFTLGNIPEAALLDNDELELLTYDRIINKIIVELAKDDDVVAAIASKVGEQTVANQITAITDALATRITALENGKFDKSNIVKSKSFVEVAELPEAASATEGTVYKVGNTYQRYDGLDDTDEPVWTQLTAADMQEIASVANASDDKVVSEKVLAKKLTEIDSAISAAQSAIAGDFVAKTDVITTGIVEVATLPSTGDAGKIYYALDTTEYSQYEDNAWVTLTAAEASALITGIRSYNEAVDDKVVSEKVLAKKLDAMDASITSAATAAATANTALDTKLDKTAVTTTVNPLTREVGDSGDVASDTKVASEKAVATALQTMSQNNATAHATINSTLQQVSERVSACESLIMDVDDKVAVSSNESVTTFTLTHVPNAQLVQMFIGGAVYFEGDEFTVDRTNKIVTWTFTAANSGFNITSDVASYVRFRYKSGTLVTNTTTTTILHQDTVPSVGTYKVGDLVYRITMVQGGNIGWVCTTAGTPGSWTEFGVVNFGETITPVEESEEQGS